LWEAVWDLERDSVASWRTKGNALRRLAARGRSLDRRNRLPHQARKSFIRSSGEILAYDEALDAYDMSTDSPHLDTWYNTANLLGGTMRYDEALSCDD
jgi:hypothetical protein